MGGKGPLNDLRRRTERPRSSAAAHLEQFAKRSSPLVFTPRLVKPDGRLSHSSKATPVPRE